MCICNMNLCDLDLQGLHTIAQGFVTKNEADKTTNTALRQNFVTANCWLIAAIESLRQENNRTALKEVVPRDYDKLEFRWEVPILYTSEGVQILDTLI
jgi:hypothetical protein